LKSEKEAISERTSDYKTGVLGADFEAPSAITPEEFEALTKGFIPKKFEITSEVQTTKILYKSWLDKLMIDQESQLDVLIDRMNKEAGYE